MFELFESIIGDTMTVGTYAACIGVALACGVIAALAASFRNHISAGFAASLILLPPIVCTLLLMVNKNVGTGIAVAGAFSLVRFRSAPGKAREIVFIFLVMTAGLCCSAGYIWIGLLLTALISLIAAALGKVSFAADRELELKITIPESLNYTEEFDDLFSQYTRYCKLTKVKTSNMGSLYKIDYRLKLKDDSQAKQFLDDLRCRNGNLEIMLCNAGERSEEL